MVGRRIAEKLSTAYEKRLLIQDDDSFSDVFDYASLLTNLEYEVIQYDNAEQFRLVYEVKLKNSAEPIAVIAKRNDYIPYDIRKSFYEVDLSLESVYPRLNSSVLKNYLRDIDLIDFVYNSLYSDIKTYGQTEQFIENTVFSLENIKNFLLQADESLVSDAEKAITHSDWICIAKQNARFNVYASSVGLKRDSHNINEKFKKFIFEGYQRLSGIVSKEAPAILPKTIDLVSGGKVALVVADGMSLFDFELLSRHLSDFEFNYNCSFALIPTTTSISRQSLLSGKYPQQLDDPFSLIKEESGFLEAAVSHGYTAEQCFLGRGYNAIPGPLVKFAAIILNDIDNIVHGQTQGRQGMYNDMNLFAKNGKIQELFSILLEKDYTLYLTSDHGNTNCIGKGSIKRSGVETETKSKRMVILKDFASISEELSSRTFPYPGFYLDKGYQYLICNNNTSFDILDKEVMTHGGITVDEVIVPFVKIRSKNNG